MNPRQFDTLTRSLFVATSRRGAIAGLLLSAPFTGLLLVDDTEGQDRPRRNDRNQRHRGKLEAEKRKKHKKKKKCKVKCGGRCCGANQICSGDQCCSPDPVSVTCQGKQCGTASNNCGQQVNCGTCQGTCVVGSCQNNTCVFSPADPETPCTAGGSSGLCCTEGMQLVCSPVDRDVHHCGQCDVDCGDQADRCAAGECRCGAGPACPNNAICENETCGCTLPGQVYCDGLCLNGECCVGNDLGRLCGSECVAEVCCGIGKGCAADGDCCSDGPQHEAVCHPEQHVCCKQTLGFCTPSTAHRCCSGVCNGNVCQ